MPNPGGKKNLNVFLIYLDQAGSSDGELRDDLRQRLCRSGDTHDELNVLLLGEVLEPGHEIDQSIRALVVDELEEIVNKDMRNVIVAGVQAVEHALQEIVGTGRVDTGIDQAGGIGNVIRQLAVLLENNNVTVLCCNGSNDEIDQLFRLTGTLFAQNYFNHGNQSSFLHVIFREESDAL